MSVHQHGLAGSEASRALAAPDILYLCCSVLLVGAVAFVHLFAPVNIASYDRDVWHHMAVLNELMRAPFHPANPHVVSDAPSRSFMPWHLMLALLGRWTGLDAQQLLGVSAALTMATLMIGVRLFASSYFGGKWAACVFLAVLFGTWAGLIDHTGFYTLTTFMFGASYPFAIVLALGFVTWWLVLELLRAPRAGIGADIAIALLTAFMFTTHQLQGAFAIGAALTFALFHGKAPTVRRGRILAATVIGLGLCHFWIYFDPIAYSFIGENYTFKYRPDLDWTNPYVLLAIFWASPLGLFGLYDFKHRAWRRDLLIGMAGIFAGILGARLMGSWIGFRFLPFLVMFLQLGLAAWLVDLLGGVSIMSASSKRPAIAALCIAALFNAGAAAWETVSAELYLSGRSESPNPYQSRYILDSMARVKALVGPGKVVLAWDSTAYPVQASGMKVVSIPRPFPEVPDSVERQAASKAFFTDSIDPAARCAILARYDVAALLYPTDLLAPDLRQALATLGRPVVIHDLTLVPLTGSACAAVTDSHDTTPSP